MVKGESRQLLYTPEINERRSDSHDAKINGKDELAYTSLFTSNCATFKLVL
jgi:hypothetical protein